MKIVMWIVGVLLGFVLLMGIAQTLASERVEVVELQTKDEQGELVTTRLWIVDDEGHGYLRGDNQSQWAQRLMASESFTLIRDDEAKTYTHEIRPDKAERINDLMREKYTWGDEMIEVMIGGRDEALAIQLIEQ